MEMPDDGRDEDVDAELESLRVLRDAAQVVERGHVLRREVRPVVPRRPRDLLHRPAGVRSNPQLEWCLELGEWCLSALLAECVAHLLL